MLARRAPRRRSVKHAADTDVLVDVGPPYPSAFAEDLVVRALLRGRIRQPPRPGEGHADGPPISESGDNERVGDFDGSDPRFRATTIRLRRSAHATPPDAPARLIDANIRTRTPVRASNASQRPPPASRRRHSACHAPRAAPAVPRAGGPPTGSRRTSRAHTPLQAPGP